MIIKQVTTKFVCALVKKFKANNLTNLKVNLKGSLNAGKHAIIIIELSIKYSMATIIIITINFLACHYVWAMCKCAKIYFETTVLKCQEGRRWCEVSTI